MNNYELKITNYELMAMGNTDNKEGRNWTIGAGAKVGVNAATMERMRTLSEQYPWFDDAVIVAAGGDVMSLPVHILMQKNIRPSLNLCRRLIVVQVVDEEPAGEEESEIRTESSTIDIIDCFIDKGEHKVAATDATPEYIPEITLDGLPDDDELFTEDLAEVYLNQELFDHAKVIYDRLSLLNPKKSVYFAEIIENAIRKSGVDENIN
jgi:hypothetical protein